MKKPKRGLGFESRRESKFADLNIPKLPELRLLKYQTEVDFAK